MKNVDMDELIHDLYIAFGFEEDDFGIDEMYEDVERILHKHLGDQLLIETAQSISQEALERIAFSKDINELSPNPYDWSATVAYQALGGILYIKRLHREEDLRKLTPKEIVENYYNRFKKDYLIRIAEEKSKDEA